MSGPPPTMTGMETTIVTRPAPASRTARSHQAHSRRQGGLAGRRRRVRRRDGTERQVRVRPRRAVLPVRRRAPRARLRGPAAAHPAARAPGRAAHREHARRAPRAARARVRRDGGAHRVDRAAARRRPARPAARRDRHRVLRPVPGRDARAHHDDPGLPVLDRPAVARHPAAGKRRSALVAGHRRSRGHRDDREVERRLPRRGAAARLRLHGGRAAAASQQAPGRRRGALRGPRLARLRLAGRARLAEPRGLPRAAGRRVEEPRRITGPARCSTRL